jgi:hypothetical protein
MGPQNFPRMASLKKNYGSRGIKPVTSISASDFGEAGKPVGLMWCLVCHVTYFPFMLVGADCLG